MPKAANNNNNNLYFKLTYLQLEWTGPQVASASLGGPV